MRILHLLNHTRRLNGHVHAAIDLACAQAALGHQVTIASEGGDFDGFLSAQGIDVVRVSHERKPLQLAKGLVELQRAVSTRKAEVVHAHMMTSAVLAWPICQLARIPLVTTVHNAFEKSAVLMGLGTRVIAVSTAVGHSMKERGIAQRKLRVVLNGTIGSARVANKDRTPRPLAKPAVVFVGGMHPRKGLPDLVAAFELVHEQCPEAHLYLVGGGPMLDEYRTLVQSRRCAPAVTFFGPQDDPFPYLGGADVFVLPSHADPAPLVLSEAREAGCAVVATDVDGIPEMLEDGRAGVLVPPRDPPALANAVLALVRDPARLNDYRERSQLNIGRMRVERVARETLDVYRAAVQAQ
ncbi:MAG TPA: glycosyltransferase family 4 protein [Polyangiales bacterium]